MIIVHVAFPSPADLGRCSPAGPLLRSGRQVPCPAFRRRDAQDRAGAPAPTEKDGALHYKSWKRPIEFLVGVGRERAAGPRPVQVPVSRGCRAARPRQSASPCSRANILATIVALKPSTAASRRP